MARKPRMHLPGALYHVMLRGNARQDVFFDEEDRRRLYELLEEGVRRFGYRVHAFCLMTNHIHLALQQGEKPLSGAMQNLSFRYTRHVNGSRARVGHLFQGRYKALLVDADSYGLELVRYIHLNPVRARLVAEPSQYPHSGHLGYLGRRHFGFLTTDWVLGQFGEKAAAGRRAYARFVAAGIAEGHREEFHRGQMDNRVLGPDRFTEQVLRSAGQGSARRAPRLDRIVAYVCAGSALTEEELRRRGKGQAAARCRALIGWLAKTSCSAPLAEVARRFERDLSSVSHGVTRLERAAREGTELARLLKRHQDAISQAGPPSPCHSASRKRQACCA